MLFLSRFEENELKEKEKKEKDKSPNNL